MALMNTLRNKMGKFVVGAVAVAILSFVLTDLLGPNSKILGGQDTTVGSIAGNTIDQQEFQNAIEEQRYNFILTYNRNPSETDMVTIRNQAWEKLFSDIAFGDEFGKLGIRVTSEELVDMVQGQNIQPELKQAFTDPATGQFDKSRIVNYLANFSQLPPQQQEAWNNFERNLLPGRRRLKYERLILGTEYVTQAEAIQEYHAQNDVAEVKYVYIPFYSLIDSLVDEPTDSELEKYLDENGEQYKVEEARSFKYVTFPIIPSADDSAYFRDEMQKLKGEFQNITDDSLFARNNSDNPRTSFNTYNPGTVPPELGDIENIEEGQVIGPVSRNQFLSMYKLSEITEDTVYSARARHILFKWEDESAAAKRVARDSANMVLRRIQRGEDFAAMASQYGTDGTAIRGGDLGWFSEGRMVESFEDAVMAATRTGLLNELVETQFGYHIIDVTNTKTNVVYKIATIEREITAGDQTINDVYRQAEFFALDAKDAETFEAKAASDSITILNANDIDKNNRNAGSLVSARQIVQWLYNDASVGDVSEVFELDDQYVVALMTAVREEGVNDLDNIRNEILVKVKNEKKAGVITEKLNSLSGSIEEIASAYGTDATVQNMSDLKLNGSSLNGVGLAPEAVGVAFSLASGERARPIIVDNGVVLIELVNITQAPEVADYTVYKDQVRQRVTGRTAFNIAEAIRDNADIEDERYKFY